MQENNKFWDNGKESKDSKEHRKTEREIKKWKKLKTRTKTIANGIRSYLF